MRLRLFLIPAICAALSACNEFPELDHTVDSAAQDAPYPDLVPVETLKAGIPEEQIEPETREDLEARMDRLKARARKLKGTVIDDTTQKRMEAGIEPVTN